MSFFHPRILSDEPLEPEFNFENRSYSIAELFIDSIIINCSDCKWLMDNSQCFQFLNSASFLSPRHGLRESRRRCDTQGNKDFKRKPQEIDFNFAENPPPIYNWIED